MDVTFSETAKMILSRHDSFRKNLLIALENELTGNCFIDGKAGRAATQDELIFLSQNRPKISLLNRDLAHESAIQEIVRLWSSPAAT